MVENNVREKIDSLSYYDIGRLLRFGNSGNILFEGENYSYLMERFKSFGGWTPEQSKMIGW